MSNSTKIILDLIKEYKTTKAQLERECGLSNGTIHNWEKGKNNPSYGAIVKIAKFFNVSENYIMGEMEEEVISTEKTRGALLEKYDQLSAEQQKDVIRYMEFLLSESKEQ